jgi:hypothetical protein
MKNKSNILIIILFYLFIVATCGAEEKQKKITSSIMLLMEEGAVVKNIPLSLFYKSLTGNTPADFKVSSKIREEDSQFKVKGKDLNTLTLSRVTAGNLYNTTYLLVSDSQTKLKIKSFVTDKGAIKRMSDYPELYGKALNLVGDNFALIDEKKVKNFFLEKDKYQGTMRSKAMSKYDQGELEVDSFSKKRNASTSKRALCIREFSTRGRQAAGILNWQISNPRELHTLKDELEGGNSSNFLRCPRRKGGTTDYYVDGLYRKPWFREPAPRVMKIPDHCTVTIYNSDYTSCCTAALIPIFGTVGFINPRDRVLTDWPDNIRICQNTERICTREFASCKYNN